jgi:hypothetical protein
LKERDAFLAAASSPVVKSAWVVSAGQAGQRQRGRGVGDEEIEPSKCKGAERETKRWEGRRYGEVVGRMGRTRMIWDTPVPL